MCKALNISRSVTSAYHPQCNGLDERTNQTLKTRLGKLSNEHQDNWPEFLPHVAYSMRTQKQKATKHTPYFLLFARHPRSFLEVFISKLLIWT